MGGIFMKKLLFPIFLITIMIMSCCIPTNAAVLPEDIDIVLFEVKEITDNKALMERMKHGITDDNSLNINTEISKDIFTDEKGIDYKAIIHDKKTTSQKIKSTCNIDGTTTDLYVANANVECLLIPVESDNEIITQGYGNSNLKK